MLDLITALAVGILSGCLVFGAIGLIAYAADRYSCNSYAEATGRETKFVGLTCYGKIGDTWYSSEEYKKIIVPNRLSIE